MKNPMMSISTAFNFDIPLREQLPMIKRAGFTHVCPGGGNIEHSGYLSKTRRKNINIMLKYNGLKIHTIHAPHFEEMDISSLEPFISSATLKMLKKTIDAAVDLNAEIIVLHPAYLSKPDEVVIRKEILVGQIKALLDYIGKENVKLAIENLRSEPANEILSHSLDKIENSKYGFCYDSSHDNLTSQPFLILKKYSNRLFTTHISDNFGKKDDHILPFEGVIKWDKFCKLFSKIDFNGVFFLEVQMLHSAFKSPQKFLNEAFLRGQKLLKQLEKL